MPFQCALNSTLNTAIVPVLYSFYSSAINNLISMVQDLTEDEAEMLLERLTDPSAF